MDSRAVMNQDAAIGILRASAIVRGASRLIETVERAARHSSSRVMWSELAGRWQLYDRSLRLRSLGIALVTAVMVHIALLALQPLPGWRGFVVPAVGLVQGLLLIVAAPATRSNH